MTAVRIWVNSAPRERQYALKYRTTAWLTQIVRSERIGDRIRTERGNLPWVTNITSTP